MSENRVKQVRKSLNITQGEFGKYLGVTATAVSRIEKEERALTEQMAKAICREFNINYEWLTEGVGQMKLDIEVSDAARFAQIMYGESESKKKLFRIVADMPDELLEKMVEYLESKFK